MLANMESVSGFLNLCSKLQPTKPRALNINPKHRFPRSQTQAPTAADTELQESGAGVPSGVPEAPCWPTCKRFPESLLDTTTQ